jgi:hypothetical protein
MPLEIHIDPQFEALRRQMRRYRPEVIEKATLRTLNRLATRARTQAARGLARAYQVPIKTFRKRVTINPATRQQHRAIIGFPMSRGSKAEARTGSLLITLSTLYRHLSDEAILRRLERRPQDIHTPPPHRPFIQSPRGYRQLFARQTKARYPIQVLRTNLAPHWRRLQTELRTQAAAAYPAEWTRNANYYKTRARLR